MVDESVPLRLSSVHPVVALSVSDELLDRLPCVGSEDRSQPALELRAVTSIDQLIGCDDCLPAATTVPGLVDHDVGVGRGIAMPGHAACQQESPHARCDTDAHRMDTALGVTHAVVQPETVVDAATRRTDVHRDRLVRGLVAEVENLRDQCTAALFGDGPIEKNDPLQEECGIRVHDPFATTITGLDDAGDDGGPVGDVSDPLEIVHLSL